MIIRSIPILLIFCLSACGGGGHNEERPDFATLVFPDALPDINPAHSDDTPDGIWMLVSETDTRVKNGNTSIALTKVERQFIRISSSEYSDNATHISVAECEGITLVSESKPFDTTSKKQTVDFSIPWEGSWLYQKDYYFSDDFKRLYGTITRHSPTEYPDHQSINQRIYGIKVSDALAFDEAQELTTTLNNDAPTETPICVSTSEETSVYNDSPDSSMTERNARYLSDSIYSGMTASTLGTDAPLSTYAHDITYVRDDNNLNPAPISLNYDCITGLDCDDDKRVALVLDHSRASIGFSIAFSVGEEGSDEHQILMPEISVVVQN